MYFSRTGQGSGEKESGRDMTGALLGQRAQSRTHFRWLPTEEIEIFARCVTVVGWGV